MYSVQTGSGGKYIKGLDERFSGIARKLKHILEILQG